MDNETHYVNFDADELWAEMQTTYVACGGDILYPGDEKEILLRAVQAIAVSVMAKCDAGMRQDTRKYAQGEFLDLYGDKRNCERIEAMPATAEVEITFGANGVIQTIPAGTELTADGVVLYHLTEDIEQTGAAQTVAATIECSTAGTLGNGLLSGTQMQFIQTNDAIQSIITTSEAAGGQDREQDDAYRERIRIKGLANVTTGTAESYRSAAMAVSSVIIDAIAVSATGSYNVAVYLLLSDDSGASALIDEVQAAISGGNVRPLTDRVSVALATKKPYTLNIEYVPPMGSGIGSAVDAAVEEYQAWQERTLGRAFNPDKLVSLIYQAGAQRVIIGTGSAFDGGAAEYTEIDPNEVCSGTITTAVMDI